MKLFNMLKTILDVGNKGYGISAGIILLAYIGNPAIAAAEEANLIFAASPGPSVIRQLIEYKTPELAVIRQDDKKFFLNKELDDGRPVVMSFIFTSCAAICPMLSHTLMKVQNHLSQNKHDVHLVSISIDPENDTPAALMEYAKKFSAGPNWDFYTGSRDGSIEIQKAFNVFRGDKMNHGSIILIRYKPGTAWVRLEGFTSAEMILEELAQAGLNKS